MTIPHKRVFDVPVDIYPFEDKWLECDGLTVHYVDEGPRDADQTIVFFHGNPTWSLLYRGIIPRLSSTFRCVCIDHPGYGFSERPPREEYDYKPETQSYFVEKVLRQLNLTKFAIFVQDWGGPIGLGIGGRNADWVTHVIAGDTFAFPIKDIPEHRGAYRFSTTMGAENNKANVIEKNAFLNTAIGLLIQGQYKRDKKKVDAVRAAYMAPWSKPEWRYPTWISPHDIVAAEKWLGEVEAGCAQLKDCPALIFWGQQDPVLQDSLRPWFEEAFPHHKTVLLPEASHFFQEDEPELVADEVRAFLSE